MAGREAQILTDDDDDSGVGIAEAVSSNAPAGLANNNVGLGSRIDNRPPEAPQTEFEIIETDDNFNPLDQVHVEPENRNEGQEETLVQETQQEREERAHRGKRPPKAVRQREAKDRTVSELNFLRSRVQELETKVTQSVEPRLSEFDENRRRMELTAVENALAEAESRSIHAYKKMSEAMVNADGDAFAKALQERDEAILHGQRLQLRKNQMTTEAQSIQQRQQQPAQQTQPTQRQSPPIPSMVQEYIDDFTEEFPWYNPKSGDVDSQIVLMLDNEVASEGFDSKTPEYWEELRYRMERRLPDRFESQKAPKQAQRARPQTQQIAPQKRGPQIGGGSERSAGTPSNQVYINPDRKRALIAAGALDSDGRTVVNRDKFNGYLKQYRDFDRANGVVRQ